MAKKNGYPHVCIVGAARTPIGVKCGTLSEFSAEDLAVFAGVEAIRRAGIAPESIDTAVGANVYQFTAPHTQDLYFPRNVGLRCGLKTETPALMVQRICGSGVQTIINAFHQIVLPDVVDDTKVGLCFGAETMSRAPQIDYSPRRSSAQFWEFGNCGPKEDSMLASLDHTYARTNMMRTADEYGHQTGVTREECDRFAEQSQERARKAWRESHLNGGDALKGLFALDGVNLNGEPVHLGRDECVRETSYEVLAKLPGFTPNKLVSSGNASEIADGAAAVVIADRDYAEKNGLNTRYEIASYGISGVEPCVMGRGPVPSIEQALKRAGVSLKDIDLWEINEAFAAQYLGVEKELKLDREKVNVNGGAIAIGHPLAATGGRLVVDLMYEMQRRDVALGCASACIGGGQGIAIIIRDSEKS